MTPADRPRWPFFLMPIAPLVVAVWAWFNVVPSVPTWGYFIVAFMVLIAIFNFFNAMRLSRRP